MNRMAKVVNIPFAQSLWEHVHAENRKVPLELINPIVHWGKKHSCRKCRREGTRREYHDRLSSKGWLFVTIGVAATIGIALLAVQ